MSLVICSSAQDKYQSDGNLVTTQGQVLPVSLLAPGMQNPAQFTNNINPVMVIPANSEVALKDISFNKNSVFKIGNNVSLSVWIGELLRSRWGAKSMRGLADVTSVPIPVPLQPGTYNSSTFANMLEDMLNQYISYPDLMDNISVVPATQSGTGSTFGYVFKFEKGSTSGTPADRSASITNVYADARSDVSPAINQFTWTTGTKTYLNTDAGTGFDTNRAIMTDMPISLNGGNMTWDVTNCTGGWRIGFTRPTTPRIPMPRGFSNATGVMENVAGYYDFVVEYATRTDGAFADTENTLRIFHSVYVGNNWTMREVEYYNNDAAHFTPTLNSYLPAKANMYRTTAATFTDLTAHPTSVTIKMFGEDSFVSLVVGGAETVMTDSRLCIAGNANVLAQTPTRNLFIKPTGSSTHALYPKISLFTNAESAVLTSYTGITSDNYEYPLDEVAGAAGPGAGPVFPVSPTGSQTSGSSIWGRRVRNITLREIMRIGIDKMDKQTPYQSNSAVAQKQYVGLDGPTTVAPAVPVRIGEGAPFIPDPAVGAPNGSVAYSVGLITIPSIESASDRGRIGRNTWGTDGAKGVYICGTTDVSELLGFRNTSAVLQSIQGNQYLYTNRPQLTNTAEPEQTLGAFYGWHVASTSAPLYRGGGAVYLRCPTLTHKSYNFGKGIPSKIIASIPPESFNTNTNSGQGFFAPSEMTYLTLNNTEALHFNDITLEIVDKNEQIVDIFQGNTTVTLHFRSSK
tara:strand:+ start:1285 stop:3507 length:2223 start_codon:yes stop_codon:yes gene_type:complete